MRRISLNGQLYALPFEKLFRPHTEAELKELTDSIRELWIQVPVVTYDSPTHGRAIIDGIGRTTVAGNVDGDREIPVAKFDAISDEMAKQISFHLNSCRRHLNQKEQEGARGERIKRVVTARVEDRMSLRAIAIQEKISLPQVQRDLRDGGSYAVDTPDDEDESDEPERIEGRDGKFYPATRAPVIVAKLPPGFDRDAALVELAKARRQAAVFGETIAELLRGPLAKKLRKVGETWKECAAELEAVEA